MLDSERNNKCINFTMLLICVCVCLSPNGKNDTNFNFSIFSDKKVKLIDTWGLLVIKMNDIYSAYGKVYWVTNY